jgi:hypothetical protein
MYGLGYRHGFELSRLQIKYYSGFAHFRFSSLPVSGHRISFQLTGTIVLPASLTANTTPRSFLAVVTK